MGNYDPERETLACALYAHQLGMGDLCTIIWGHFGVARGVGRLVDRSAWNALDSLVLFIHDEFEDGGRDPRDEPASSLAREVIACCAAERPENWNGRSTVRMSERSRVACILFIDELIRLLERAERFGVRPAYSRTLWPARQIAIWAEVRDVLADLKLEADTAVDQTVATAA